jgi:hypothetical protein
MVDARGGNATPVQPSPETGEEPEQTSRGPAPVGRSRIGQLACRPLCGSPRIRILYAPAEAQYNEIACLMVHDSAPIPRLARHGTDSS